MSYQGTFPREHTVLLRKHVVLISCFALGAPDFGPPLAFPSNLQVRMMKELIDRAVAHVALNARRNTRAESPIQGTLPSAVVEAEAPVASSWWPSFWRVSGWQMVGFVS